MEMAIGNAPWPIGVTNAGIHARPARENIFSKHVAHVLNDETQRKFIQVSSTGKSNSLLHYFEKKPPSFFVTKNVIRIAVFATRPKNRKSGEKA